MAKSKKTNNAVPPTKAVTATKTSTSGLNPKTKVMPKSKKGGAC